MMSKTIIIGLAFIALAASGACSAVDDVQAARTTTPDLTVCIEAFQVCDDYWGLNIDLGNLIAQVLGILSLLVNAVLAVLAGILSGPAPPIPAPTDLGRLCGFTHVGLRVLDLALRVHLGVAVYNRPYLAQLFVYVCLNIGLNVSGSTWAWCVQDSNFDLNVFINALLAIQAQVSGVLLIELFVRIQIFINLCLGPLSLSIFGDVLSILWNIILGYSYGCGYNNLPNGHQCIIDSCDPVLINNGCGPINQPVLTGGNYCYSCA